MEKNNSTKIVLAVVALIVVLALAGWAVLGKKADAPSSESTSPTTSQSTSGATSGNPDASVSNTNTQSEAATITFTNEGFTPRMVTVKKGSTVVVKNNSSTRVQFSSDDHPTHRLNTEMNLKTLAAGESASFVAEIVGTHGFHDHIDDSKTGTLVVTE